ncbi:MAG: hypothetical protein RMJ98_12905 [Myxococcales bacterium]|nr:hypothetical protein [Polyangiaceae bacterium]MDW8250186.1 hypothetical protein [Myxococcales bacterium]
MFYPSNKPSMVELLVQARSGNSRPFDLELSRWIRAIVSKYLSTWRIMAAEVDDIAQDVHCKIRYFLMELPQLAEPQIWSSIYQTCKREVRKFVCKYRRFILLDPKYFHGQEDCFAKIPACGGRIEAGSILKKLSQEMDHHEFGLLVKNAEGFSTEEILLMEECTLRSKGTPTQRKNAMDARISRARKKAQILVRRWEGSLSA